MTRRCGKRQLQEVSNAIHDRSAQPRPQVFTGGLRTSWFNASWPLASMALSEDGVVIRVVGLSFKRWAWAEVESVERVAGGLLGSPGVRLQALDGARVVFWSFSPEAVVAALAARGVKVVESNGRTPKVWLGT